MERLTRVKDEYPCRLERHSVLGTLVCDNISCNNCPLEKIINKLAEYEDKAEEQTCISVDDTQKASIKTKSDSTLFETINNAAYEIHEGIESVINQLKNLQDKIV